MTTVCVAFDNFAQLFTFTLSSRNFETKAVTSDALSLRPPALRIARCVFLPERALCALRCAPTVPVRAPVRVVNAAVVALNADGDEGDDDDDGDGNRRDCDACGDSLPSLPRPPPRPPPRPLPRPRVALNRQRPATNFIPSSTSGP